MLGLGSFLTAKPCVNSEDFVEWPSTNSVLSHTCKKLKDPHTTEKIDNCSKKDNNIKEKLKKLCGITKPRTQTLCHWGENHHLSSRKLFYISTGTLSPGAVWVADCHQSGLLWSANTFSFLSSHITQFYQIPSVTLHTMSSDVSALISQSLEGDYTWALQVTKSTFKKHQENLDSKDSKVI